MPKPAAALEPLSADEADEALHISQVRRRRERAEAPPSRQEQHERPRDSVDRYLRDLDATERITPSDEIALAERLFAATAECLALAREVGVVIDGPRDEIDRDGVIRSATRLWRLLDEHDGATRDPRRTAMATMVEEELGADGVTLGELRTQMATARERAGRVRQQLTQANLALVVYVAKAYRDRGVPMADLIQEGNISLMGAVERFDPDRGARLGTYATAWLHRSMHRTVRSLSRTVRLPESARHASSRSVPIDEPVSDARLSLTDILCEQDGIAPDDMAAREQIRRAARQHLAQLSMQEAVVVRRRFGIDYPEAQTLQEIGDALGLTRERIRQIESQALDKLRRRLRHFEDD